MIDLLATTAVLALLGFVLLTTVAMTRPNVASFHCLTNLRQVNFAWRMYADDNRGKLAPNPDNATGMSRGSQSWAGGWLDFSTSSDNTNIDLLVNHARYPYSAFLGPYLKTASVFKCPADRSVIEVGGQQFSRVRSISLNNYLGEMTRTWSGTTSKYPLRRKLTEIRSPARIFTFLHEREDSINDALFWTNPDKPYQMIDYPGGYHDGAGSFAFVDGHCEMHRWLDPRTMPVLTPGKWIWLNVSIPGDVDIDWLQEHAAEPRLRNE